MSTIRPTTVEVETSLRLVAPDATALPVRASLRYDPADPYAVHVLFHAESAGGEAVSWSFARELLVTGLDEPAGIGDVRVWPWATPRGDFVALALSSPDGNALFEVPRSVLVRFRGHFIPQCSGAPSLPGRNGRYRSKSTAGPPDAGRTEYPGRTRQDSVFRPVLSGIRDRLPTTG